MYVCLSVAGLFWINFGGWGDGNRAGSFGVIWGQFVVRYIHSQFVLIIVFSDYYIHKRTRFSHLSTTKEISLGTFTDKAYQTGCWGEEDFDFLTRGEY